MRKQKIIDFEAKVEEFVGIMHEHVASKKFKSMAKPQREIVVEYLNNLIERYNVGETAWISPNRLGELIEPLALNMTEACLDVDNLLNVYLLNVGKPTENNAAQHLGGFVLDIIKRSSSPSISTRYPKEVDEKLLLKQLKDLLGRHNLMTDDGSVSLAKNAKIYTGLEWMQKKHPYRFLATLTVIDSLEDQIFVAVASPQITMLKLALEDFASNHGLRVVAGPFRIVQFIQAS